MSAELSAPGRSSGHERVLSGWGRLSHSRCEVVAPSNVAQARFELEQARVGSGARGLIARGAGLSYGDAAQNAGGIVLDMTCLDRIVTTDLSARLVTAQAGVTLARLLAQLAIHDMTLPVVPGTSNVTLGGAIASDIHGKNHHRDGGFARHVVSLSLLTASGEVVEVSADGDPELFYATFGGMGLTGIILEASIRIEPLETPWVAADTDRTGGLQETLALLAGEERRRYSVAWLDLLAPGPRMGRAVISRADSVPGAAADPSDHRDLPTRSGLVASLTRDPRWTVPRRMPGGLLSISAVRAFNALRWRAAPRHERGRPTAIVPFFFPLDAIGAWNRLYGRAGLIQYQFVIPDGAERALEDCFRLIRARRLPVYLAVFKRFGPAFGGPLSFPLAGWTLAIDLPGDAPGLRVALDALDELVAGAGGRVYLSKDVRLRTELLTTMYPQIARFRDLRARVDPHGVLRSDLARRLQLCGVAA